MLNDISKAKTQIFQNCIIFSLDLDDLEFIQLGNYISLFLYWKSKLTSIHIHHMYGLPKAFKLKEMTIPVNQIQVT